MSPWDERSDGREGDLLRDPSLLPPREERGCPSGETWTDLVAGVIPEAERDTLLDHLAACPDCTAEVRALREVAAWAREATGEAHPITGGRASSPFTWPWAAALAAAVLLPFLTLVLRERETGIPIVRGETIAAAAVEPSDGALLTAPPATLRWSPVADAHAYRVQVLDGEGSLLWSSPQSLEASVTLPPEVRTRLASGQTYLWRVEILLDGDRRRSPTYEFRLAP